VVGGQRDDRQGKRVAEGVVVRGGVAAVTVGGVAEEGVAAGDEVV